MPISSIALLERHGYFYLIFNGDLPTPTGEEPKKVNILRFITDNIPLYVCFRDGLIDELKYCYYDIVGNELTEDMINEAIHMVK